MLLILISTLIGQGPTGSLAIAFQPPAVQYGEVYHTVHQRFFTGCPRCFQRTCGCVQPYIYSRNKAAGQLHVVVFEENNLAQELRTTGDFNDALYQSLSGAIV